MNGIKLFILFQPNLLTQELGQGRLSATRCTEKSKIRNAINKIEIIIIPIILIFMIYLFTIDYILFV